MRTGKQVCVHTSGKQNRNSEEKSTSILHRTVSYGKLPYKIYGMVAYVLTDFLADTKTHPAQKSTPQKTLRF